MQKRVVSFIGLFLLALVPVFAQSVLKSPSEFLGYPVGSRFSRHHQVVDYVRYVAQTMPNVKLIPYGETNEGRPLLVVVLSSPANMDKLEEIRLNNLRMAGVVEGKVSGVVKPVVWLSYNVHGNEPTSSEAAMEVLYSLLNKSDAEKQAWLEKVVVVIDPCMNPDGRDRYVNWYNMMVGRNVNPVRETREHQEPWPGGRANHYLFDLNRDWSWLTQKETQGRIQLYNQWLPQVHADYHEQGVDEPYYFPPAAEPLHQLITPWQREAQVMIGKNNARYFDQNGWMFFSKERFDLLYPAYGDTYPMYNGSIGMTYEQGGIGGGLGVITAEGDTLTLRQRIDHHDVTSLSIVEVVARDADRYIREYQQFYKQTPKSPYKTFVLRGDEGALATLRHHLDQLGIRYGSAGDVTKTLRGFNYRKMTEETVSTTSHDLVVSLNQPKAVLTQVLFEPKTALADSLTYDITAWALPHAYNLEAWATAEVLSTSAINETVPTVDPNAFGYIATWKSFRDAQFLAALLQNGVKVRYTTRPLKQNGKTYPEGSLIIAKHMNMRLAKPLGELVAEVAKQCGKTVDALASGMSDEGPDLGSEFISSIKAPRVALLAGKDLASLSVGEIWHYFDNDLQYPLSLIHGEDLARVDLQHYDVLILPAGYYANVLNDANLNKVKDWLRNGGRLIAVEEAVRFLSSKDGFGIKVKTAQGGKETKAEEEMMNRVRSYAHAERESLSEIIPGAVYRTTVDATHPLGYGYQQGYTMLKQESTAYEFLEGGVNVGVLHKDAWLTGFAGSKVKASLKESLVFGQADFGRGKVVFLTDNPLFRGFWYGGKLLFANAVFMVGQQ